MSIITNVIGQSHQKRISNDFLTDREVLLFDSLFLKQRGTFTFKDKNVAFISGHSATDIESKKNFFDTQIEPYISKKERPIIVFRPLNNSQKKASGGYDVIIMQVPKILTKKQERLNFENLRKSREKK